MEFHKIADIFPMIIGNDWKDLCEDIKKNGLIEPIVLYEDKILDGRNRYTACMDISLEPEYEEYTGDDPLGYVVSKNLVRRHLKASQRAMIAARLATMKQGERTDIASIDALSQPEAADMMNVSRPTVQRAKQVLNSGDEELIQAVDSGEIAVSRAVELSKQKNPVLYSSQSNEWNTPKHIVDLVLQMFGSIDLDPCSNDEKPNIPAGKHYRKKDNGLIQEWVGKVYMNPPYGREISNWVNKLVKEHKVGNVVEAIALVPSRTDTEWFRTFREYPRCFVWGRLKFGNSLVGATFPSMVVYLGQNEDRFLEVFKEVGDVYKIV